MRISFDDSGAIIGYSSDNQPPEASAMSGIWTHGTPALVANPALFYVAILPRPGLDLPPSVKAMVKEDCTLKDLPIGAIVAVDDVIVGTVDDGTATLAFPFAGQWRITITPAFPTRPHTIEVEVVDAN